MEMNKLFIFLFLSLLFLQTSHCEANIIKDICKTFSSVNTNINYDFCTIAFQADPRSSSADLEGLGVISMQLTMALVNKTAAHIERLKTSDKFDAYDKDCLDVCLELYTSAKSSLTDSLRALKDKRYRDANIWVSSVMDAAVTCEDGFKERGDYNSPLSTADGSKKNEGNESPLSREDGYLIQLTAIILQIINKIA